jgi:AraC-like DNA-binding protein
VVPQSLLNKPEQHKVISLNGCTLIESCHYKESMNGNVFVSEHELIHIISGKIILDTEGEQVEIHKGETVLIKKGSYLAYDKRSASANENYQSVLFFLNNNFIEEFIKINRLQKPQTNSLPSIIKIPSHPLLHNFIHSLIPYFSSSLAGNVELLRIKTFEFLFNLAEVAPEALPYFFQLIEFTKGDLVKVMEKNFMTNIPLEDFAYLSGRSLSTFKRDFALIFKTTPHKWLHKKRLEFAHYVLKNTDKSVSDVCLESGFEDLAHFSKSFRKHFGYNPSHVKMDLIDK